MTVSNETVPSDGSLVNLLVNKERHALLREIAMNLPEIALNERQMCDLELLATGAFSPLSGFMVRLDYESILDRMRLQDDTIWPIPICLDITEIQARNLEAGQSVGLTDPEGFLLAILHVEDIWEVDRKKEASAIFGTDDKANAGVRYLFDISGDYYIGGKLEVLSLPLHYDYRRLRMPPEDVRRMCNKLGWQRIIGYQTRDPIHRPQFETTLNAMRQARANMLMLPLTGITSPGDLDHYTRLRCYQEIVRRYPPDSLIINLLPLSYRFDGPRNVLLQAIISKNFGCTHFIVDRDQLKPVLKINKKDVSNGGELFTRFDAYCREIGVTMMASEKMVYLPFEDEYRSSDEVPDTVQSLYLSDMDIRERIRLGRKVPEWATFPEVLKELHRSYPPPRKQGLTIFFTGLSGSGKSTLAKVLYSRFMELGDRSVTLLDGDIVRRNLSSELTFSKEHRDINVRRIGFVASEITKNFGVAICAPIAPYELTRSEIRAAIETYGGFIEIHVSTPIEICEKRDRKGMYQKARAGLIKGFTGVDDPYENPKSPELRIDTTDLTPDEAVQEVLLFLGQKGYI